uniref:Glutamine amidotransferase-like class 1 domain-containing protein 1 n=1 Tax=Cebus imitator TaxID=2715852 RepID=A0A2K5RKI1_CEBIM
MAAERLPSRPACLLVASGAAEGVSAQSFLHCFTMASTAFNLQVATPGGKAMDFVDVTESNARWVQDFRLKAYASPAKLESIDGARYHALLIPSCPGALTDLASSGSLARILQHFRSERKPICAVGHGVAALCCATNEDRSWVFHGYSLTGPSVCELVRAPGFARLPLVVEDFVKDSGASFSAAASCPETDRKWQHLPVGEIFLARLLKCEAGLGAAPGWGRGGKQGDSLRKSSGGWVRMSPHTQCVFTCP